jgi:hypothetical protein
MMLLKNVVAILLLMAIIAVATNAAVVELVETNELLTDEQAVNLEQEHSQLSRYLKHHYSGKSM